MNSTPPAASPHGERTAQSNQLASDGQLPGLSCRSNPHWITTKFVEEPRDRELYISVQRRQYEKERSVWVQGMQENKKNNWEMILTCKDSPNR